MLRALVSRSHGCVDSIVEHETGEYIDIRAEGVCRGLMSFYGGRSERIFAQCRESVVSKYDQSVVWSEVRRFYEALGDGSLS